ncbi:MAG: SpaH/EbpB family LPXTG-anchored major pilin, partial [Ruminococcus sp.]|nr:SpaH/EbpB family LPXTG-anchored major pilin [Ruminococcus sp.]
YYCVAKANTSTVQKIGNAVIVWPEYDEAAESWDYKLDGNNVYEAPLDTKVASGSEYFDKYFAEDFGKTTKADYQLHGQNVGDVVNFVLEGNVVGSTDEKLTAFTFSDDMCPGLDYVAGSMHVYYDGIDGANCDSDFDGVNAVTTDATGSHFTVSAKAATLSSNAFYTKEKVYVKYQATVNNNAVVGEAGNPNTGSLKYSNNFVTDHVVGEATRYVWTFNVDATKYNGATNQPLAGATFAIASDNKFNNIIATGTSAADGKVEFKAAGDDNPYRFAPGTYYVKETDVPDGFALSTTVYTVTISDKVADYSDATSINHVNNNQPIENYPVKLPETGGNGTMMFTIIGGVLVLLAGAMFVIIMKKRSSSK